MMAAWERTVARIPTECARMPIHADASVAWEHQGGPTSNSLDSLQSYCNSHAAFGPISSGTPRTVQMIASIIVKTRAQEIRIAAAMAGMPAIRRSILDGRVQPMVMGMDATAGMV